MKNKKIEKPWGGYEVIHKNPQYWVKKLYIKKGHRFSLQSHEGRAELWMVLKGKIKVQIGTQSKTLGPKDIVFVPPKTKHRIEGLLGATVLELACGSVKETDIKRLADDYGRAE